MKIQWHEQCFTTIYLTWNSTYSGDENFVQPEVAGRLVQGFDESS